MYENHFPCDLFRHSFGTDGLLLAIGAAAPAPMFDYYQEFSQKALSVLSGLTGVVPFAVWEVLALLLILWAIYTLIECLRRGRVLRWLSGVLVTVCTLVLLFVALWGLNHFGPTVGERMELETRPYSVDEVYEAALWYAEQANTLAAQMPTDSQNVTQFSNFSTLAKSAGKGYTVLSRQYDCFTEAGATVKKLTAWPLYSYSGITGIFIPFTGESNVNPDTYAASCPLPCAMSWPTGRDTPPRMTPTSARIWPVWRRTMWNSGIPALTRPLSIVITPSTALIGSWPPRFGKRPRNRSGPTVPPPTPTMPNMRARFRRWPRRPTTPI